MKNLATAVLFASIATLAIVTSAEAATSTCQPIYGGGQTCVQGGNVIIDKKVEIPGGQTKGGLQTNQFKDDLGVNDPKYSIGETVNFKITVSNTGGQTLSKITITDYLPKEVTFVAGVGNYDANNKTLTFEVLNLQPNESREFIVSARVVSVSSDQAVVCNIENRVVAISDGQAEDKARFCVQKEVATQSTPSTTKGGLKVFPPAQVKTTPSTGPELFALAGLIPSGLAGFFLRRKASK